MIICWKILDRSIWSPKFFCIRSIQKMLALKDLRLQQKLNNSSFSWLFFPYEATKAKKFAQMCSTLLKKVSLQVYSSEFCKTFESNYPIEHLWTTAFAFIFIIDGGGGEESLVLTTFLSLKFLFFSRYFFEPCPAPIQKYCVFTFFKTHHENCFFSCSAFKVCKTFTLIFHSYHL